MSTKGPLGRQTLLYWVSVFQGLTTETQAPKIMCPHHTESFAFSCIEAQPKQKISVDQNCGRL